jgi:hypothetical protein
MTNTIDPESTISILQRRRERLIVEAKRFASLLDDHSTSIGEIDSSIEELQAIRLTIYEIDSQIRLLIEIHPKINLPDDIIRCMS